MTTFIQHVVDALSVGSTYALLALGLTLVFSVMNLINFAYGMMLVWSGYVAIVMLDAGVPFLVMVPALHRLRDAPVDGDRARRVPAVHRRAADHAADHLVRRAARDPVRGDPLLRREPARS